ncbi:hypothetical protein AB1K62_07010 [Parasphingorhabdus sp. JC815]|uniref:hypothetical protein n=1 Tax=Parasphingorhabdus sp. JC815 TaxID=3232140 RepID=UPI0034598684
MHVKLAILTLTTASLLGLGAPGIAAQEVSDAKADKASEVTDDSHVIKCERQAVTGSRARKKRVCLTMAEWRARREAGRRTADDFISDANKGFPEVN